jgi:hypothetical protein
MTSTSSSDEQLIQAMRRYCNPFMMGWTSRLTSPRKKQQNEYSTTAHGILYEISPVFHEDDLGECKEQDTPWAGGYIPDCHSLAPLALCF